jgi:hypothetical protein
MVGLLHFIKMLFWKFIRSFVCVDGDMHKAKLPLPFDVAQNRNGGASRQFIYN